MSAASPPARLTAVPFARLAGWTEDDHAAAFAAFRRSALSVATSPPKTRPLGPAGEALARAAAAALRVDGRPDPATARLFFETWFEPHRIEPVEGAGFVTGYFEPEVDGAETASDAFRIPLYARPDDLQELKPDDARGDLDPQLTWARRLPDGSFTEHPDRAAIMAGALSGRVPVIAWLSSWVEAFFIHVQGSARVRLPDGRVKRVTFAGKTGHPYFPIARVLVERGLMQPREATADVLKAWLIAHPEDAPAVMARNRSFIFFREADVPDQALGPIAAAGVPLTPGRSLAVDRHLMTFHAPVFLEADFGAGVPGHPGPFRRLMVAQDTGSAILGPARGDIFFGSGEAAWAAAARVRHPATFTLLLPRGDHRLVP